MSNQKIKTVMKKMIFAMTIAAGIMTASFANAQTAEKKTEQKVKPVSSKTTIKKATKIRETNEKPSVVTKQAAVAQEVKTDGQSKSAPKTKKKAAKVTSAGGGKMK